MQRGSVKIKNPFHNGSPKPKSICWHFWNVSYHRAAESREAVNQFKEVCHLWLRPEIHPKEQISELLVLEQFLTFVPREGQSQRERQCPQSTEELLTGDSG